MILPVRMRIFARGACALIMASVALPSCHPSDADPQKVQALQERNAAMRAEIAELEAQIARAGEIDPSLPEKVKSAERELVEILRRADALDRKESELDVRLLELQNRLDNFHAEFKKMQAGLINNLQS